MDFKKFLEYEGQVIEPVPEAERDKYRYWRAAHLGRIALNLSVGDYTLNAGEATEDEAEAHFFTEYLQALRFAQVMVKNPDLTIRQFNEDDYKSLLSFIDRDSFSSPVMVYALDANFNDGRRLRYQKYVDLDSADDLFLPEYFYGGSPLSTKTGPILDEPLTLDKIDQHSRAAIRVIFDLEG